MIPERQERKEVSPIVAPAFFLKRVSRQWQRERKPGKTLLSFLR